MVWVRSEYASELAVVLAWFSALLPWNVTFADFGQLGRMVFVRFPLAHVQYLFGTPTVDGRTLRQSGVAVTDTIYVADPASARAFYAGADQAMATANLVWGIGALLMVVALLLSVALYVREERVEDGPADPVRAMGSLLGAVALAFTVASVQFWRGFAGVSIPLCVPFLYAFAGVLLTVDRE